MNPLNIIQDSLYFFRHNLLAILLLCLPPVILEGVVKQAVQASAQAQASTAYELIVGLLFYPLYSGALILFMDARTRGENPPITELWGQTLRLWPSFALLSAISTLLIMFGLSLFVLPGLWVMIKLAFSEYLLVLRQRTPFMAMRESMLMTTGHFTRILVCLLIIYIPISLFEAAGMYLLPAPQSPSVEVLLNSLTSFLQLFMGVTLFRLFMLIEQERPAG
ncbi:YciC family protein [uncultured Pseudomonas sp.]|uniref:YciC family protein n=1 Tax=uncultured Pseudomonas sp. TaxID=114707 RepID=UPI0025CD94B3|nr:YciC family protein [uncultured Pseudomonas sp.]